MNDGPTEAHAHDRFDARLPEEVRAHADRRYLGARTPPPGEIRVHFDPEWVEVLERNAFLEGTAFMLRHMDAYGSVNPDKGPGRSVGKESDG